MKKTILITLTALMLGNTAYSEPAVFSSSEVTLIGNFEDLQNECINKMLSPAQLTRLIKLIVAEAEKQSKTATEMIERIDSIAGSEKYKPKGIDKCDDVKGTESKKSYTYVVLERQRYYYNWPVNIEFNSIREESSQFWCKDSKIELSDGQKKACSDYRAKKMLATSLQEARKQGKLPK